MLKDVANVMNIKSGRGDIGELITHVFSLIEIGKKY